MNQTEEQVRLAVRGESRSAEWLVERFEDLLLADVRFKLGRATALVDPEDVAQEVWLRLWPKLGELRERNDRLAPVFVCYLRQIATNVCNNVLRKALRRGERGGEGPASEAPDPPAVDTTVVSRAQRSEAGKLIREALAELSRDQQDMLALHVIDGRSQAEIGRMLDRPAWEVSRLLQRAFDRLRAALPQDLVESWFEIGGAGGRAGPATS